jgi:hypothetical protein
MPRIALATGLLVLGWLALASAALGVAVTPAEWCNAATEPSGQVALHVGLAVAGSAIALSFIPAVGSEHHLRGRLALAWIALVVALLGVVLLARVFAGGGYYCG